MILIVWIIAMFMCFLAGFQLYLGQHGWALIDSLLAIALFFCYLEAKISDGFRAVIEKLDAEKDSI